MYYHGTCTCTRCAGNPALRLSVLVPPSSSINYAPITTSHLPTNQPTKQTNTLIPYLSTLHPPIHYPSASSHPSQPQPLTMGSLCSKESTPDPFAQPGRALSSAAPPQNKPTATAPVPRIVGGPPRTLGGGGGGGAPGTGTGLQTDSQREDARRKAAEAAQVS